ncbi:hypothetical protein [Massilia sp. NR 4-1]|uniref:hypothetical protein n=1 Tax=Massilia sp. NR 4-1 TaxID=1678028 RepID=UPI00067AC4F1|nr:hypothetical protein [Massilia sp. NR 4-1]AKU21236.1 hypothetical protein ACZ75_06835 [Massilia sp. NR 4-1]
MDIASSILLLLICGIVAYRIVKWFWPIIEQRKNLTPEQMIERALQAPAEEAHRKAKKFGSRTKTAVITLVNAVLLYVWLWGSQRAAFMYGLGLAYLAAGFVVQHLVKVPATPELAGLNVFDRVWFRIFYAWFWPVYVPYIFRRK